MLTPERQKEILEELESYHSPSVCRICADLFQEIERLRGREKELIHLYEAQGRDYDRLIIRYCQAIQGETS
jgi:hypothetical protein